MTMTKILAAALAVLGATAVHSQDSELLLGKSTYGALCVTCHGEDGKGGGEIAELFKIPPADLTKLASANDGVFPYLRVYNILSSGMGKAGHGEAEMPVWGDYFVADALEDRGIHRSDAIAIAAGRIATVTAYLETIQE